MERQDLPLIGHAGAPAKGPKPLTVKGDPSRADSKPAIQSPPTASLPAPAAPDDHEAAITSVRKIEELLRESKRAKTDREEARIRIAGLEHDLAQAEAHIESLKASATQTADLQKKLAEATRAHVAAASESANLKVRVNELDALLKAALGAAASSEMQLKKQETALSNAKEARDEAQRRVEAALAALQGRK